MTLNQAGRKNLRRGLENDFFADLITSVQPEGPFSNSGLSHATSTGAAPELYPLTSQQSLRGFTHECGQFGKNCRKLGRRSLSQSEQGSDQANASQVNSASSRRPLPNQAQSSRRHRPRLSTGDSTIGVDLIMKKLGSWSSEGRTSSVPTTFPSRLSSPLMVRDGQVPGSDRRRAGGLPLGTDIYRPDRPVMQDLRWWRR
jgi:hypothetical protein